MLRTLKEWWITFRFVPVLNWTIVNSLIALALAKHYAGQLDYLSWFVAALVAWTTQGYPAHVWNDIFDWLSGTDKLVDIRRTISGGSHAIQLFYRDKNVFLHLKNHVPWLIACAIAAYYFVFVMGWWWYVVAGAVLAVYIAVFYSAPPIQADHRAFFGEWGHAFPGILLSDVLIYYAAAHDLPPLEALLLMSLYVIGNVFMLEMHHVNDIYPDLNAEKKKYTAVSWIYEKTKSAKRVHDYFVVVALVAILLSAVTATILAAAVMYVPLYIFGATATSEYERLDFEKYPEYLDTTVRIELRWIVLHTVVGLCFAGIVFFL